MTAKPTDRRAVLEEAAGIAGLHVRRHEAELRLDAAENNLKRADELRRQQERQLQNLLKQAEEATKYKIISEDIKKIEAGLYYLKLKDIDNEIKVEKEINNEADNEVKGYNEKLELIEKNINEEIEKVNPIRDKNFEILSKIQRLNLELKSLDDETIRIKNEIENNKKSIKILDEDIGREKSIVIDAKSNEKRIKEEKNDLIEIDSKYYQTEKASNEDLEKAKNNLQTEQKKIEQILKTFSPLSVKKNSNSLEKIKVNINKAKDFIKSQEYQKAEDILDECNLDISHILQNINEGEDSEKILKVISKNENIKKFQEQYASFFSKNENIKKESLKRNERIKTIDTEIQSWNSLLINSEKMIQQLNGRKNSLEIKLTELEKEPQSQAEKKGQISESLRLSEKEKEENQNIIFEIEQKIKTLKNELNNNKEKTIEIRERKASSGATVDGLKKRKDDLLERVQTELNLNENNLLEFSNLDSKDEFPDSVSQEELLDEKKRQREKLGSVNLKADEEQTKYQDEIKKMEKDRQDLVTAIIKLKESISELNQKGRERLIEAFERVNRKFNEVYTKLFNGGNAKLELVDSEDPLDAGLEMLVSPPGKRLQSSTLLS